MKQITLSFFVTIFELLISTNLYAFDCEVDGIYYNRLSADEFEVTYGTTKYIGDIVIPKSVTYNEIVYNVTSIGSNAFYLCKDMTSVIIPNSVTTIGEKAFYRCSALNEIIIPNSVTTIEDRAFYECTSLKSVTIGTGLEKIRGELFGNNNPAKVFWLPNTPPQSWYRFAAGKINYVSNSQYGSTDTKVYEFLSSMFEVNGVKYIPVSPSERTCDVVDYVYDKPVSNLNIYTMVSNQGIDMRVLNVQPYSFYQNLNLKNAVLDIAGEISEYAFSGCTNLLTTMLGNSITGIGEYAFSGCAILEDIIVPASVDEIGQYAFSSCTNMTSAIIGDGTKTIGSHAFSDCSSLTSATIGNSTKFIQQYAFSGCSLLQTITIPGSVRLIDDYTFSDCKSLKEIVVKANNTDERTTYFDNAYVRIGSPSSNTITIDVAKGEELSFNYDHYQVNITVSFLGNDNVLSNSSGTFKQIFNKDGRVSIVLTLSSIAGYNAYCNITNMKLIESGSLLFGSNGKSPIFVDCPLDTVFIDRDLAYRSESNSGYSPFYRNAFLRSLIITNNGEISDNEFLGCTNLQNVQIGDGVTSIGNWAFSGCSSLNSFSFGTNVSNIGKEAFSDCTAMTQLISHATTPPSCGNQALDDINKWACKLTVPQGCLNSYQAAEQWKDFFFMEEGEPSGIQGITLNKKTNISVYDLNGRKLTEPAKGINIIGGKKVLNY